MSQAARKDTTQGVGLPGLELSAVIVRMRDIAAASGDALFTEGPVQPDHKLLDLCAEALHWRKLHDDTRKHRDGLDTEFGAAEKRGKLDEWRAEHTRIFNVEQEFDARMRRIIFEVKKLRATTAAGIYAKALIVRSSKSGAPLLAMSLADDLIACPGLRESLWPAAAEGAA